MTGIPDTPPRFLRWADTPTARSAGTLVALVALIAALLLGLRQQAFVSCVAEEQAKDAERTRILGTATDAERAADRELIAGPAATGKSIDDLRAASAAARDLTDQVRAANPPPPLRRC